MGKNAGCVGEDIGRLKLFCEVEKPVSADKLDGPRGKTADDDIPRNDGTVGRGGAE